MKNDINLLTLRKNTVKSTKKRSIVLFIILFVVALAAAIILPMRTSQDAQLKLQALKLELQQYNVTQESFNETVQSAALIGSRLAALESLNTSRSDILSYLEKIEQSLPTTAELARIEFSGNVLSISGTAPDDTAVATFLLNLRESSAFPNVFLTSSNSPSAETPETMFTISATLPAPLSGAELVAQGDAGPPDPLGTPDALEVQE